MTSNCHFDEGGNLFDYITIHCYHSCHFDRFALVRSHYIPRMIGESSPSASSPHRAGPLAGTPCRCTPGTPPSLARPSPRYESHRSDQTALGFGCSASVVAGSASGSVSGCSAGPPQPGCTPGPAGAPGGAPG